MIVACVQMNGDAEPAVNVERALGFIEQACDEHRADLVVLPEFFNTFYFSQYHDRRYLDLAEQEDGPSLRVIRAVARDRRVNVVAPIYELDGPGRYFDTAFLIDRQGEIVGRYRKVHPAATNSLEKFYFRPGAEFPVWDLEGWRVGIAICYDTFFPESARTLAVHGAELLVFPFAGGQIGLWRELHRVRAFENLAYVAVSDKVGREREWTFGGKSLIVDPLGTILAEADDRDEGVIAAQLDREEVFAARRRFPMYRDRQPWAYEALTERR